MAMASPKKPRPAMVNPRGNSQARVITGLGIVGSTGGCCAIGAGVPSTAAACGIGVVVGGALPPATNGRMTCSPAVLVAAIGVDAVTAASVGVDAGVGAWPYMPLLMYGSETVCIAVAAKYGAFVAALAGSIGGAP